MGQYELLYQQATSDPTFVAFLASDTAAALQSIGIDPTPENVSAVQNALAAIVALHNQLDPPSTTAVPIAFVS